MSDRHYRAPNVSDQIKRDDDGYELRGGVITEASRARYQAETRRAAEIGCVSVILGCTEVGMLLSDANSALPTFDTTLIHAAALIDFALST